MFVVLAGLVASYELLRLADGHGEPGGASVGYPVLGSGTVFKMMYFLDDLITHKIIGGIVLLLRI